MIFSNSKKFIFVKTRKCGGTSIQNTLLPFCDNQDYVTLGFNNLITKSICPLQEFSSLNDLKSKFNINLNDYYKFGFVRNPYAIVLSRFFYQIKEKRVLFPATKHNFNLWVKNEYLVNNKPFNYLKDKYSKFLFNDNNEPIVDFIGKLENSDSDFEVVKNKLGIDTNTILNNDNKSNYNNIHYREWMSEETIVLVKNFFSFELEYFKYEY